MTLMTRQAALDERRNPAGRAVEVTDFTITFRRNGGGGWTVQLLDADRKHLASDAMNVNLYHSLIGCSVEWRDDLVQVPHEFAEQLGMALFPGDIAGYFKQHI